MVETNDIYRTPEQEPATELNDGARFDLHQAGESTAPYESIRLAREAVSLAGSTAVSEEQPGAFTPEHTAVSNADLIAMGTDLRSWSRYVVDGQLNIFDDEAA